MYGLYLLRWSDANQYSGEIAGSAWSVCQAYRSLKQMFASIKTDESVQFFISRGAHEFPIEEIETHAMAASGVHEKWVKQLR